MAKPDESSTSVTPWLRQAELPVRYDVEAGLERHRELVTRGAPLPGWAQTSPAARWSPWLRRLGGLALIGGLSVGAVLLNGPVRQEPVDRATSTAAGSRSAGALAGPATAPADRTHPAPVTSPGRPTAATAANGPRPAAPVEGAHHATAPQDRDATGAAAPTAADPLDGPEVHAAGDTSGAARQRRAAARHPRATDTAPAGRGGAHPRTQAGGPVGEGELHAAAPQDGEEIRQLVRARQLLPIDPLRALKLVREGEARFGEGYLQQERRYLEVRALRALGRGLEADARADWFAQDYPDSAYLREVRGE